MISEPHHSNDWPGYRRLIVAELERINEALERLNTGLSAAKIDIALLQLKASAWGAASGAVVAIGTDVINMLSK
jgi:hypothetical protein